MSDNTNEAEEAKSMKEFADAITKPGLFAFYALQVVATELIRATGANPYRISRRLRKASSRTRERHQLAAGMFRTLSSSILRGSGRWPFRREVDE